MREIKFRGWDSKGRRFFKDIALEFKLNTPFAELLPKEEIILQQYTGLKDKTGKEIYEGDIVKVIHNDYARISAVEFTVEDEGSTAGWSIKGAWRSSEVEVVGNIYENPGLIT